MAFRSTGNIRKICVKINLTKEYDRKGERDMVTSIARQSVIIKCNLQKSVMLGNYEFYYAAGLVKKLYGLDISSDMEPEAMSALIL